MRLATVELAGLPGPRPVVLRSDGLAVDLAEDFATMRALVDGGPAALDTVSRREAQAQGEEIVAWHAPLRPAQLRDFIAFEQHLRGGMRRAMAQRYGRAGGWLLERVGIARIPPVWYERPLYYKANRFAVVGHEHDVAWPAYAEVLDYELELACVIGRTGRDVSEGEARGHIFGFTIFDDVSARDVQAKEMGPGFHLGPSKSKDFDTANVLGPCIVTADAIDAYDLTMVARVDGEEWSRGHSGTMHWSFEQMIAYVSRSETLHAGEVFGSGTVGGGCGLELGRFPQPGQTVELEVPGIGVLRNRFVRS